MSYYKMQIRMNEIIDAFIKTGKEFYKDQLYYVINNELGLNQKQVDKRLRLLFVNEIIDIKGDKIVPLKKDDEENKHNNT